MHPLKIFWPRFSPAVTLTDPDGRKAAATGLWSHRGSVSTLPRWSRWASLVLAIGPIVTLGADSYGTTYLIDIDFGPVTVVTSPKYAFRTVMFDRFAIWASRVRPPKQLAPELRLALLGGLCEQ